jgi:sugar phosphate permease
MGNWFNKGKRGLFMGVWSGSANVKKKINYFFIYFKSIILLFSLEI